MLRSPSISKKKKKKKRLSALVNKAAETSKDADDMKVDRPWNIVHIRLPPKKMLSDASLILSNKVPRNTSNAGSKEVPESITDSLSPRAGLCNEANSDIMSKTLSADSESDTSGDKLVELDEANVSTLSNNLRVAPEEQGSDAGSYADKQGLCEEANNSNPSMIPSLPVQKVPEDNNVSSPSKNHATNNSNPSMIPSLPVQKVPEDNNVSSPSKNHATNNSNPSMIPSLPVQKVPEDNNVSSPSKNHATNNSNPSMIPSLPVQKVPEDNNVSSPSKNHATNNSNPSMIPSLPVQKVPEDNNVSSPSKNHATTGKQGEVECNNSPRKKLLYNTGSKLADEEGNSPKWNITITTEEVLEGANHPIPTKLTDKVKNNDPNIRPTEPANKCSPHKRLTSSVQVTGTSQNTFGMNLSPSVCQAVEQITNDANVEVIKVYQEFKEKVKPNAYLDNLYRQATVAKTNPSITLSTNAVECEVFEDANHTISTHKLSDVARNKAPSNRLTVPAKKSTLRKKPVISAGQATAVSQNTSAMRLSISDGPAVKQNKCAADLEAIKQYQEFEEKVKRTVYLDNLSHQATEAVIKAALSQFCTIRKVSFVVNYTIPYDIPQSALVEMETEKDAEVVVSMLHDFPFMMSGMPRPVRAIHATAEMFYDRPRRPGSKLKFRWVGHTNPDFKMVKKLKLISRKHEVENLALIEHELEEEKLLAAKQRENLNVNCEMMETMDSVLLSGMSNYLSSIYNVNCNDMF